MASVIANVLFCEKWLLVRIASTYNEFTVLTILSLNVISHVSVTMNNTRQNPIHIYRNTLVFVAYSCVIYHKSVLHSSCELFVHFLLHSVVRPMFVYFFFSISSMVSVENYPNAKRNKSNPSVDTPNGDTKL